MKLIQVFGTIFMAVHLGALLFLFKPTWNAALPAIAIYLASLALFWWAVATIRRRPLTLAFSTDAPQHVVTTGPYRWIRHPLYTSYALAWFAGIVATHAWWLGLSLVVMGSLYWRAAVGEEAKFAAGDLAVLYRYYVSRTGMFWPNPFAYTGFTYRSRAVGAEE